MTNPALHKACAAAGGNCEDLARLLGITPTRDAIVERVAGDERPALAVETLNRIVRAVVMGAG
jgi:hypothetical protein